MVIKLVKKDGYHMFVLKGDLDRSISKIVLEKMWHYVENDPYLILDMSMIDFIDSSGVSALVKISDRLTEHGARLWLYKVNSDVFRVLNNTGVTRLFDCTTDMDKILSHVRPLAYRAAAGV